LTAVLTANGSVGRVATAISGSLTGAVAGLTATPTPRPSVATVSDAPTIVVPKEAYTRDDRVDVVVSIPGDVVGDKDAVVQLYLERPQREARPLQEAPVGDSKELVMPQVPLATGRNFFTATIRSEAGESEHSTRVTYVLDLEEPRIELRSPRDGETVNAAEVALTGKTQGRTNLTARSGGAGKAVKTVSGSDGTFELLVPLTKGENEITLKATDPAGNTAEKTLKVERGEGELTAKLEAAPSEFRVADLPDTLEVEVTVTDPDERPLPGAAVTFTVTLPGIPVIRSDAETGADGRAVFRTTVPAGATPGTGLAAAYVRTESYGDVRAWADLTVVP
jgi:hypothetical protein